MTNLVDVVEHLSPKQRLFLVRVIQKWMDNRENFHAGLLPFLSAEEATLALAMQDTFLDGAAYAIEKNDAVNLTKRFIRKIQSVIREHTPHPSVNLLQETVPMQLSDAKVFKRFKAHRHLQPQLTFNLPTQPNVSVGLRHLGRDKWQVMTNRLHTEAVTIWLAENLR